MAFLIHGIDPALFAPWFALSDAELAVRGARRRIADDTSGFPCRVSLAEPELGEELLLVPFEHHAVNTPYRGTGAIWVRRVARAQLTVDRVPELLATRLLSLRGYDDEGMMSIAEVVDGRELAPHLERMLDRRDVAYIHVHYAKPGCFACRVTRPR